MKKITAAIVSMAILSATNAQQLGIGGMNNHMSNGILLTYSPQWNKNWKLDLGLRIYAKVNLIGNNEQQFSYYQQGYAKTLPEYFALNFRLTRRIFTFHFVEVGFMSNLFINWEGIRNDYGPYRVQDPNTGQWLEGDHEITYYNPSPAAEFTIGPAMHIKCSSKISIYGTVGYGIIYMHHSHTGWSETFNRSIISYPLGSTQNWERGVFEMVGIDGLPMISFGVKYRVK